jgi:putative membrane protein
MVMAEEIPKWLSQALTKTDVDRIEEAVRKAELSTSAEIVPMIVHRSTLKGTGDRIVFWISFGILGVGGAISLSLLGGLDEALLDRVVELLGLWPSRAMHLSLSIAAETLVGIGAVGFSWLVARLFSTSDSVHRFVFPRSDMAIETEHRAQNEFYSSDLRSTAGKTGVLLMVSMLERRAVILADEAITEKFHADYWTKTLNELLRSIRAGKMADGFVSAIEMIGEQLAKSFPIQSDDRNELSNKLRIEE